MPIAWDLIAATFRAPLRSMTLDLTRALERIARWLDARVQVAAALELNSRGYPVIGFYDEAVTLSVEDGQRGALRQPPERGVGETLRDSGRAFVRGVSRVGEAAHEEWLIPSLFNRVANVFDLVASSLERFIPVRPGMFDVRERTASDLFGEAGLAFRTLTESLGPLRRLAGDVREARDVMRGATGATPAPPPAAGASATPAPPAAAHEESLSESLDRYSRYVVGAVLLLPVLPQWIAAVWRAASVTLRFSVLEAFQGFERQVFGLRRQVFDVFSRDLPDLIVTAMRFVIGAWLAVELNWRFYVRVTLTYGRELITNLDTFFRGLEAFLNYWITVVNSIVSLIDAIKNFDLAPIIAAMVLGPLGLGLGALGILPRFTVADAMGAAGWAARNAFRVWLVTQITAVEAGIRAAQVAAYLSPLDWILGGDISDALGDAAFRVGAARRLVWRLFRGANPLPGETVVPFTLPGFPNVFSTFVAPGLPGITGALSSAQASLETNIGSILGGGMDLLLDLSTSFDRTAAAAASAGSPATWRRIAEGSVRAGDLAFGDQISGLRARIAGRGPDALADAFEGWLSHGGFYVVGTAIPLYVQEMDRYWREQSEAGIEPEFDLTATSPHKLVRRAALGRVRVPELTVRARGRPAATALAATVAARFQEAVGAAYVEGKRRMAEAQETARLAEVATEGAASPTE